jgi:tetratricopeptide (TPR) repeat protein
MLLVMQREPMVFSVAGLILGFALGYMVANAVGGQAPKPTTAGLPGKMSARPMPGATTSAAKTTQALDPAEVRALTSLAEKEKDNLSVRVELGNLFMDHDRCEDALRWYDEALALSGQIPDIHVDKGACLVRLNRYEDALASFDRALKVDPDHKKAVFNKGVALAQTGRAKDAIALWEGLLKRHPNDPQLQGLREHIERLRGGQGRT